MVLVHGNSLSAGIWTEQLKSPALAQLRLHAIDLPGHGESPSFDADKPYTLDAFAAEIAGFIHGMERPVLVGHSLGGHVCMRVPALAPHVRGLMLLGAPPLSGVVDLGNAFLPTPAMATAFKRELTKEEAELTALTYTWPNSPAIAGISTMIMGADPRVRGDLGQALISGQLADEQAMLRACGVPVCMVHGEREPSIPLSYLEALSWLFWRNQVQVICDAGHSPQLQCPKAFNELLLEFVNAA